MSCNSTGCTPDTLSCCFDKVPTSVSDLPIIVRAIRQLLSEIRPGTNFFAAVIPLVERARFPPVPTSTYIILLAFSALHLIIAVICLTILLWPYVRPRGNQRSKFGWIVKLIHIHDHDGQLVCSTPLILLNSGVFMALGQLMESLLSQVYIYLTFFSFRSRNFASRTQLRAWACGINLCQFYSCWAMAWTSIIIRAYNQRAYISRLKDTNRRGCYIFHPFCLNLFFCAVPALVTLMSAALMYLLVDAFDTERARWRVLNGELQAGAFAWQALNATAGQVALSAAAETLQARVTALQNQGFASAIFLGHAIRVLIFRTRLESYLWAAVLAVTCLLYVFAVWKLLRLISGEIRRHGPKVTIGLVPAKKADLPTETTPVGSKIRDTVEQACLKRGFHYLAFHSLFMILAMLCTIAVRLALGINAKALTWNASWRSSGSWLTLISGAVAAVATTFQCWRIIVDLDIIIPIDSSPETTSAQTTTAALVGEHDEIRSDTIGDDQLSGDMSQKDEQMHHPILNFEQLSREILENEVNAIR